MSFNDLIVCILGGVGLLAVATFIVLFAGYILGEMDKLK